MNASDVRTVYGITEPIVVGEFSAYPRPRPLGMWYDQGYSGALAWSLLPDRTSDGSRGLRQSAKRSPQQIGLL